MFSILFISLFIITSFSVFKRVRQNQKDKKECNCGKPKNK